MHGRSPLKNNDLRGDNSKGDARDRGPPQLVTSFSIGHQQFRMISVSKGIKSVLPSENNEHARFTLLGLTMAIIEDPGSNEVEPDAKSMIARLTERELQIAAMIAQGDATKNVAYKLRISEWTVCTHLRRIFAKLGVDNRAAMVYRCASLIDKAPKPTAVAGD
jgi:DNA-binding CsgD family transcriptional regulator